MWFFPPPLASSPLWERSRKAELTYVQGKLGGSSGEVSTLSFEEDGGWLAPKPPKMPQCQTCALSPTSQSATSGTCFHFATLNTVWSHLESLRWFPGLRRQESRRQEQYQQQRQSLELFQSQHSAEEKAGLSFPLSSSPQDVCSAQPWVGAELPIPSPPSTSLGKALSPQPEITSWSLRSVLPRD